MKIGLQEGDDAVVVGFSKQLSADFMIESKWKIGPLCSYLHRVPV